nr:glutamine amidotransferase [uncultured Rhodopila sp.]
MPVPRRSAVAIRHVAFEDLGLLAPILDSAGWDVSYCEAAIDDLAAASVAAADLLVVLGGPIGVYDAEDFPFLQREIELLEHRLARDLPTLGICLGAQLMARALGQAVYPSGAKEIGWGPVSLTEAGTASCLGALAGGAPVLHWHGDTFDLPGGAALLASTAICKHQAFGFGKHGLGLQFHIEADPGRLEHWYVGHAIELASAGVSIPDLRAATADAAQGARTVAEAVFGRWLRDIDGSNLRPALSGAAGEICCGGLAAQGKHHQ